MVYFYTKKSQFRNALECSVVYFMTTWCSLWSFGIFCGLLVHLHPICTKKSGNPGHGTQRNKRISDDSEGDIFGHFKIYFRANAFLFIHFKNIYFLVTDAFFDYLTCLFILTKMCYRCLHSSL
jgi:hypothetical protein